ncbi:RusA family crossover junction endodeoxyribonuclease [Pseudomonas aeruginosa]|uniref:RusA family crossover junction endodeoxyribonuclease n=1 Tax=Pseudomonas aeruginosa TaxID=287 RepID=UPI000EAB8291|nr:RusA family crossover junction endodeoxyribonuclease [Pseudomonas aeruginosa]MCS8677258.1 RusA family crossover junction endodeoxyribonuclease [Pseudomonas aeruginosa]MCS8683035.1 RusA family crossover junction endodeoxyribonuclease [Pseudomonas aeruginosa]MCS8790677.1 RusA family crossover junction endodeoxyribonuclease [Pseudomonas aeruginosa]
MIIKFSVDGAPRGKGRPRAARTGAGVRMYTPKQTEDYERSIAMAAQKALAGRPLIAGPVLIELRMFHPIPRSWSKKRQAMALIGEVMPTVKCDADNCLKAVCDALNGVAWKDDTQVVNVMLAKRYAEVPRVEVKIVPLMAQGAQQ